MKPPNVTMEELAVRCEALAGPDRELDALIWALVDPAEHERQCSFRGMKHAGHVHTKTEKREHIAWYGQRFAPAYTSDLNAAMSLIPEGWRIRMLDASVIGRFSWSLTGPLHEIEDPESPGLMVRIPRYACATGPCIVRSLAAASLRARALTPRATEGEMSND